MTMKSRESTLSGASEAVDPSKTESHRSHRNEEALFHCEEIVLGKRLGTGAFCDVHDLHGVRFMSPKELDQRKSPINGEIDQRRREHIHETCYDGNRNSRYVIKHLRPNLAADRGMKIFSHAAVDCLKEFDILSRLSHPNIVRLWGSATSGRNQINANIEDLRKFVQENNPETFFIVLEKVEETLSQRILRWILTKNRISMKWEKNTSDSLATLPPFYVEKLRYARDIASALAHIHSQGMVFRDLKPDNVGIASGTAKLFDFGLCRDLPLKREDASICNSNMNGETIYRMSTVGTRRYMSPEMISGHGYNQKTDTYSWAMVFYEMMSLQKPYAKYNRELHKILVCEKQGRPHVPFDIPWSARDLLKRSWDKDISVRPTMQETCCELDQMINIVEQQTLPLIERSLRAVLEMAEVFGFGNDKTLACISIGGVNSLNIDDHSERKYPSYSSEKASNTKLSVSQSAGSVIAAE